MCKASGLGSKGRKLVTQTFCISWAVKINLNLGQNWELCDQKLVFWVADVTQPNGSQSPRTYPSSWALAQDGASGSQVFLVVTVRSLQESQKWGWGDSLLKRCVPHDSFCFYLASCSSGRLTQEVLLPFELLAFLRESLLSPGITKPSLKDPLLKAQSVWLNCSFQVNWILRNSVGFHRGKIAKQGVVVA